MKDILSCFREVVLKKPVDVIIKQIREPLLSRQLDFCLDAKSGKNIKAV